MYLHIWVFPIWVKSCRNSEGKFADGVSPARDAFVGKVGADEGKLRPHNMRRSTFETSCLSICPPP